ncbi:MAG: phage portal protein [Tannerella sp.]|jgi:SPP1 family phage portal protein|nr:phage portal protein [Tannerella sp.]
MNIFNWITGKSGGTETLSFEELLAGKNVGRAIALMTDNEKRVNKSLRVYNISEHNIMERKDKPVLGKDGELLRLDRRWKIPIPYPVYINEIALVFLYGKPLKWSQASEGTDRAFQAFTEILERTRFDAKIRHAKRLAGAETQSAMLFHVYRNDEGKADVLIKTLAKSLGDHIYFRKDQFDRLTAFARGYSLKKDDGREVYHLDIYTKEKIYRCEKVNFGWEVDEEANPVGKIPVILFEQETEFDGVEGMIERREWITSVLADVNDRFSSPMLVSIGDKVLSLPEKMEDAKSIHIKPSENGPKADVRYLTWDSASESKKLEVEDLDRLILNNSFTPDISYEQLRGLSGISGRALKLMMTLAVIKADKRKETHDEYASRIGSLMTAIIGNALQVGLKQECDRLRLQHEFQEPFGDDVEAVLNNLIRTYNAGGLSLDSLIEMNPIIRDAEAEKARIREQREREMEEEAQRARMDVFGTAD